MRLSTRSSLLLLAAYLVLLAAVAFWMERELRSRSMSMLKRIERLVGREVAAALTGPAVQQLLDADPVASARLRETIDRIQENSQIVTEAVVVDATGRVIAGPGSDTGRQLAIPQLLFTGDRTRRFVPSDNPLRPEQGFLFVALREHENVIGYLRLTVQSEPIARLYASARRQLLVAGGIGLLIVAVLGLLLHWQFSRVGTMLARRLESAARGEPAHPGVLRDEFAEAFAAAHKVGQELQAARERSSEADQRLNALTGMLDVGLLQLGRDGRLDFASPRARQLLGRPAPGELEQQWPELSARLADGLLVPTEGRAGVVDLEVAADGRTSRVRFEAHTRPSAESDQLLVSVKDRESLDLLERELRLALQMRGFTSFFRAFAHDLKAPLNAMVLNLELLAESVRRGDPDDPQTGEQQRRYVEVLRSEIFRLDRDLRVLLQQAAPANDASAEFDLRDVVADLTTLLAPQAKKQRVQLQTGVPDVAVPFAGHRDRLKQALLNIAINALEAMPNGGELTVALERGNGAARMLVQDTGPGIPDAVLERIYEMNFTTKDGGSGIGLYVARSVVESHGGAIRVASAAGQGTRFEVDLPVIDPAA